MDYGINFKKLIFSFKFALSGSKTIFREEQPLRIMFFVAILVTTAMFYFNLSLTQKAVLSLIIILGLSLELINSVIEIFLDFYHPEKDLRIKIIKDFLSGIVLISCFGAVIIGILIFWPYLFGAS